MIPVLPIYPLSNRLNTQFRWTSQDALFRIDIPASNLLHRLFRPGNSVFLVRASGPISKCHNIHLLAIQFDEEVVLLTQLNENSVAKWTIHTSLGNERSIAQSFALWIDDLCTLSWGSRFICLRGAWIRFVLCGWRYLALSVWAAASHMNPDYTKLIWVGFMRTQSIVRVSCRLLAGLLERH